MDINIFLKNNNAKSIDDLPLDLLREFGEYKWVDLHTVFDWGTDEDKKDADEKIKEALKDGKDIGVCYIMNEGCDGPPPHSDRKFVIELI